MKYFLIFSVFISIASSQTAVNECDDPNAVSTTCGSSCPASCENYNSPPQACIDVCSQNPCECKPGFVLDGNQRCIPSSDCPRIRPLCSENETLSLCPRPCSQERICNSNIDIAINCPLPIEKIPLYCRPRCICRKGYVRDEVSGRCILPNDCPAVCDDPNAEEVDCPSPCPPTCDQPEGQECLAICKLRGCQCKSGYILNSQGKCVLPTECPRRCGRFEEWHPCVPLCYYDRSCLWLDIIDHPICRFQLPWPCRGKCQCIPGYVRGPRGYCVPDYICTGPPLELQ